MNDTGQPPTAGTYSQTEADTMRRVMRRIIPFLLLCYFVSFLDRVNVSFAALQMNRDLGLSPAVYGFGAGLFFLTYCALEVPSNLLLHRVGARVWIARIMVTWGVCAAAMAFIVGPNSFYAMRLLLGAAEAGFFPGILFFLTLWFPTAYRGRVLGLFMAGVPLSGLLGGPLSGLLLSLDGTAGLAGWQWLFLVEGAPAIILAPLVLLYLQDRPADATWLPAPGRTWLTARLADEREKRGRISETGVLRALRNPRVLFLAATYFTNVCLVNAITFFLPMIVKSFGASNLQTGFIAAVPSAAALIAVVLWGRHSDAKNERYGHAALANLIAGLSLLASTLVTDPTARIALISCALAGTLAFTPAFWAIPGTFLSGAAAAGGIAAISSLGVLGGFVAPSIIGYFAGVTGDFRFGLGGVAVLAIGFSILFYIVARRQDPALADSAVQPITASLDQA